MMIPVNTVAVFAALWSLNGAAAQAQGGLDWSTLHPSSSLNFTDCYNGFKCAMLQLPLDWLNPEKKPDGVTLAVMALPAVVNESDPTFGGTIITNPGGPGGSGIQFLYGMGKTVQAIADSESKKYQILSFDPRGMGESLPRADCWQDELARYEDEKVTVGLGSPANGGNQTLGRILARAKGFGELCELTSKDGEDDIRNFMSTSSVARDMVALVDKLAEIGEPHSGIDSSRLIYWGISYGTILGNYFSAMFPGRVGRMILEGVADVNDYYNVGWSRNLDDADQIVDYLWDTCFAGGKNCSLYKEDDTGPRDIRNRFQDWYEELGQSPGVYATNTSIATFTQYSVDDNILSALYKPLQNFKEATESLSQFMAGNYSALQDPGTDRDKMCGSRKPTQYTWEDDAKLGVLCGDGVPQNNFTLDDYRTYIDYLIGQSPMFGPAWSTTRAACSGWRFRPKYNFAGPWTTLPSDSAGVTDRLLAPILFLSSKLDPVTPLVNAYRMAGQHPGSTVLIQDNAGHATLSVPGRCRDGWIRKYLETGEMPPNGTMCQADCVPFQDCPQLDAQK